MSDVLLARPSDSPGYTRLLLADPIGSVQAGALVIAETDDDTHELTLHGQRELDVPDGASVTFPDGSTWAPSDK